LRWAAVAVVAAVAALLVLAAQPGAGAGMAAPAAADHTAAPVDVAVASANLPVPTPPAAATLTARTHWPRTGWLAPPDAGTPATPALSLPELRELQAALAAAPQAGADQAAVAEAMFFADVAQRFHQVLSTGQESEPGEHQALAQMLDTALDTRLQRGDISWPDARLVKAAVLAALRPQDAAVQEQVQDWEIRLRQGALRAAAGASHPPR
jgi:phage baseplate assembly protein W